MSKTTTQLHRQLEPLSASSHAGLRWGAPTSFGFATGVTRLPMCAGEALQVATALPFVFERQTDGRFQLVVLCAVFSDRNALIGTDGRWMAGYQPAVLRGYPFGWLQDDAGRLAAALDVASPNVSRGHGEPLWQEPGRLSHHTAEMIAFLGTVVQDFETTRVLTSQIVDHGLLRNDLLIDGGEQGSRRHTDLRVVKADALSALPDAALRDLHNTGALALLYLHQASQAHMGRLFQIEQARQNDEAPPALDFSLFG